MTDILYISDNNLRLQKSNSSSIVHSQGYAWLKGDQVIFDNQLDNKPINFCRLSPQEINNRYWLQCDKSSVSANKAGMRHSADLIWKHLSELKRENGISELVLVVPSHYRSENLELLFGILVSLEIKVKGIINGAILSLNKQLSSDGHYIHADVQLHQTVLSFIEVKHGRATLSDVETLQSVGIGAMYDALLKTLQKQFIANGRFDPLHNAETEQQLFNSLPKITKQLNQSTKAVVEVNFQNQLHSTSIDDKVWNDTLRPFVEELLQVKSRADHLFIQMNNAFEHVALSGLTATAVTLLGDALLEKSSSLPNAQSNNGLQYVTEFQVFNPQEQTQQKLKNTKVESSPKTVSDGVEKAGLKKQTRTATHLLQGGIAVAIEHAEIRMLDQQLTLHKSKLGNAQSLLSTGKIIVLNDESCRQFRPNDRLGSHLVDGVITVIRVS